MDLQVIEPVQDKKEPQFREPLISFVVPVYKVTPQTLKKCLESLQDQDYPNIEIICVFDGPDHDLVKVAEEYPVQIIEIEHAGACAARNAGFKASKGEIVSFFNSDYMAKPGMISKWVRALLDHPECGFAYGGYEYATARPWPYPSKAFNRYLLDVANYIDCGFPLWRKYVVEWDPNCKSLQDWDFWLRVVKTHNVDGFYLGPEASFLAEPSGKPGGLSEDSARNWIDRVHYIKSKNGIPEPSLVVTSLGAPFHGVEIAKMLKADFRDDTLFKPGPYKALYMLGFYNRGEDMKQHAQIIADYHGRGCKVILHFIGADIYWLRHRTYRELKYLAGALNLQCDTILSENEQARNELLDMGIQSEVVPIPPYNEYDLRPLPKDFKVAVFLTQRSDFDKYCFEETLSIMRAMPDVEFIAYGNGADQSIQYNNCKCVGNLALDKWKELVYESSCLFRLVRHDTMPTSSSEFILAGRDVVSNIPAPFMNLIDTKGESALNQGWDIFQEGLNAFSWPKTKKAIVQKIRMIRDNPRSFADRQAAHDYYKILLDKDTYRKKIYGKAGIEL